MSTFAPFTAPASVPRRRRVARALVRAVAWLSVAVFSLLLLAWLATHWFILPHIDRWRPLLETKTSEALGVPVRIGSIEARSSGWVPTVELRDVDLLDAQLRPALHVSRVVASVSAPSALASLGAFELRLSQLLIEGASLDVRRDAAGRVFVAGLDFSGRATDGGSGAADWFFSQHEIAIRNASLRWTDEQRRAPPLELSDVDFVARNALGQHGLRLDATPQAQWGERFSLRGEFSQPLLARGSDWQRWSGEAFVDAPRVDASRLRQYVDLPFELSQGTGALRAWLDLRVGEVSAVTLDMALREVALRLGATLEPLVVEQVHGRFAMRRNAKGGGVSLRGFEFTTGDGVHWPAGDLELTWTQAADGDLSGGTFNAGRLDLAVIASTAERLPIGEAVRALLAECAPRGIASEVRGSWEGPIDALAHYRVSTRLSGLALDAKPSATPGALGRPGLRNASIVLSATEKGGQATLAMKDGAIDLPGVFAEPMLPLDELQARLRWRIEPKPNAEPALQVQVVDARVANADAQGTLNATWKSGPGQGLARGGRFPGLLELDATLSNGVVARAARYLPLGIPESVRVYLQHALVGGTLTKANFRIAGDLWDFPFKPGSNDEFRIAMLADDVTLAYVPSPPGQVPDAAAPSPWPPLTHLSGEVIVDRTALEFRDAKAQVFGVELSTARGGIANLAEKPVLALDIQARGPVADMLRYVDVTPVGDWTHGVLHEATASGNGNLRLALALPLYDLKQMTVKGSLQLAGNDVRVRRDLPPLGAARGRVDFTHKGVALVDASARVLGGEASLAGGTQADGALRLNVQGSATADALRRAPELGPLARLAGALSGQAGYRLALAVVQGRPEINLTSDLIGMASDLPPPLHKAAESALPLHVQTTLAPASDGPPQETLRVDLGSAVHAQFRRDANGEVLRGGIGVFEPAPAPASGVAATLNLPRLDVDAWQAASERLLGSSAIGEVFAPAGYMPSQVSLKTQELIFAGRTLTSVAGEMSRVDGQWHVELTADQLAGRIDYRPPGTGSGAQGGRIYARLARLALPKSDADAVTKLLDRQPASVPALDIVVDDLELRGRHLGRIEIQAVNRLAPAREWELTRLRFSVPEAQLSATGRWAATADAADPATGVPRRKAEFHFEIDIADSGTLLARLGTPDAVRGGKGKLAGNVAWTGSPLAIDYPSMSGRFNVAIEQGHFLQVQPGAARLLGVLSLQSLARRLTFDFRDVFLEGFVFDSIGGDVQIAHGVASTNNLVIHGVPAAVLMEGSADIAHETQDMRIVVVPEINAGAASLAVAVINPAIGLGTFLAQLFLREPLIAANTREFHVTGPWADPQVEAIARQPGQAAPRIDPAPSAPRATSAPP